MASTHKHLRSSTADKRPTTSIAEGQIALNTNATSPGLFFKDSTGATIIKVGPVHVGTTAPNAVPAAGGSNGNSTGEIWLDTSLTPLGVKIWNGAAWANATPAGSTTVQGLLELATNAETQAGSDAARAVTPASLQSKLSDSTSTASSTKIASSAAVKSAYDLANAALPKAGGTVTGTVTFGTTGVLAFEGSTDDGFETAIAVVDPTADNTITLPNVSGTVVTTGDSGTVTSSMIADGTIVNADINASAAIGLNKLATGALPTGITVASANIVNGTIVNADISASAEIAVSKLADGAARQLLQTDAAGTGVEWTSNVDVPGTLDVTGAATFDSTAAHPLGSAAAPTITFTGDPNTGIYSPGADQLALSTNGTGRLFVDASGRVGVGAAANARLQVTGGDLWVDRDYKVYFAAGTAKRAWIGSSTANEISFGTSDGTTDTTVMFLDNANARLGINDVSPAVTLSVVGKTGLSPFKVNGPTSEFLRITSAGLVGIGTSAPSASLHLQAPAASSGHDLLKLINGADAAELVIDTSANVVNFKPGLGDALAFWDPSSERVRITSAGLVGIGTASPGGTVDIKAATSTTPLIVQGPSSEFARIDSSGRLLVGTSSASFIGGGIIPTIQVENTNEGTSALSIKNNQNTAGPARLLLAKSRGTTIGSHTIVNANDGLGRIDFAGADGTDTRSTAASILAEVDGTPGTDDMPGRLVFSTTADGASSPTERMRIDSAGQIKAGSLGTAAAPVWSFLNDPNTGIYSPGTDQAAIATAGVQRVNFGTTEVVFNDGGNDVDFRVEGDTRPNLFKVDASLDQVQVENLNGGPLGGMRNLLINANPMINQRSYVSGTATSGANQYTLDRWRVVTSGQSITWTDSNNVRTVTAPAGGVEQVIEGVNIISGTYTLSWTGTATATVNGGAVTNGGQVTLTGGSNATVRFSGGTFSLAQLEVGTVATPFERRSIGQELMLCQRYFQRFDSIWMDGTRRAVGGVTGRAVSPTVYLAIPFRAAPTATTVSRTIYKNDGTTYNPSQASLYRLSTNHVAVVYDAGGDANFLEQADYVMESNFTASAEL